MLRHLLDERAMLAGERQSDTEASGGDRHHRVLVGSIWFLSLCRPLSPSLRGSFGVGQLFVSPVVAVFLDQASRFGQRSTVAEEAGAIEQDIGLEQRHRAPLGYLPGLG